MSDNLLYVAHDAEPLSLNARMANRHGLIAGATGHGQQLVRGLLGSLLK